MGPIGCTETSLTYCILRHLKSQEGADLIYILKYSQAIVIHIALKHLPNDTAIGFPMPNCTDVGQELLNSGQIFSYAIN